MFSTRSQRLTVLLVSALVTAVCLPLMTSAQEAHPASSTPHPSPSPPPSLSGRDFGSLEPSMVEEPHGMPGALCAPRSTPPELLPSNLQVCGPADLAPVVAPAVLQAIMQWKGAPPAHGALVDVKRRSADQRWAFGTLALLVPQQEPPPAAVETRPVEELPEGRLWIARQTSQGWEVALDYTPRFAQWVQAAPPQVVRPTEQAILGAADGSAPASLAEEVESAAVPDSKLALPWAAGQRWKLSGGPHGWSRTTRTWSALDFAPGEGDGRVLAARDGLVYRPCGDTSYVMIRHADGWQTDYYHLTDIPLYPEGTWIESGRYLGSVGTAIACGGDASGPHVHFNIRYQGTHMKWHGRQIGGWTIVEGDRAYAGCARRATAHVCAEGLLYNDDQLQIYDDTAATVVYTGQWTREVQIAQAAANTITSAESAGSTAQLTFTGRRVSLLYAMLPTGGSSDISIDGAYRETISHWAAEPRQQVIKTWELGYGRHTIEVRSNGGGRSNLDAFVVNMATGGPGAYDNTDAHLRYQGRWSHPPYVAGADQGTLSWSNTSGAVLRLTFAGDQITYVYTKAANRGKVAVTIDGVDQGYLDLYAPRMLRQQRTTFTGLGPGVHVFHLTVTGQNHPASSNSIVDVDRLIVP